MSGAYVRQGVAPTVFTVLVKRVVLDLGNIDQEEPCPECGEVMILDGEARICYECWSNLMVAEAEEE